MDKRSILGFVVIGIILMVWLYIQNKNTVEEQRKKEEITKQIQDSLSKLTPLDTLKKEIKKDTTTVVNQNQPTSDSLKYGVLFTKFEKGEDKIIIVETDKYHAEFSTKGGSLIKYEMKGFKTWDGYPVQLLYLDKGGEINLLFNSTEGKLIDTKDLYFNSKYSNWDRLYVKGKGEYKLTYELPVDDIRDQIERSADFIKEDIKSAKKILEEKFRHV